MRALFAVVVIAVLPARAQSVYALDPPVDGAVAGVSAAAILVPYSLSDELITPRCPCAASEVPSFDRGAIGNHSRLADVASDAQVGVLFFAPVLADAIAIGPRPALAEDTVVFAETLLVNGALVTAAKYLVQRPLPRTYAGEADLISSPGGYRSFYSGHASTAAAALAATAMTIRYRYGEKVWPWVLAGALTGLIGAERVLAGRHFPSDVTVGAIVGTGVGIAVPMLHHRGSTVRLSALGLDRGAGLALVARW